MNIVDSLEQVAAFMKRRFMPLSYDAATHDAESYYAGQYLNRIDRYLATLAAHPLNILEAGCGSGRFLIPLAERGHRMTGVDYHRDSVQRINGKLAQLGIDTAEIHDGDLNAVLPRLPAASYDAVLCLEVLYTSRDRQAATELLYRLVKPGGLLFITHKPRSYFLWQSLRNGHLDDALLIQNAPHGRIRKGQHRVFYNWQSPEEIDALYRMLGAQVLARCPIGPYSGFSVDPLSEVCNPERLSAAELEQLARLESEAPEEMLTCSRYILVICRKPD